MIEGLNMFEGGTAGGGGGGELGNYCYFTTAVQT